MKSATNCCKLQVIFKSERNLSNMFRYKDSAPYDLVSDVVYEFTCGRCNSSYHDETKIHLNVRSGNIQEYHRLFSRKQSELQVSSIRDHLLECDNNPLFNEFTILANGNKKYLLEIKERLLSKRDEPLPNKNISSATLHLFDTI